jgi:hypothetical protein
LDNTVDVAARLIGYDGSELGPCLTTCINEHGGRVAVMGYAPWTRLESGAKRSQLYALSDWACNGRLPLRIDRHLRVAPFIRLSQDARRFVAVLLNASYDCTGSLDVQIRANSPHITLLTPQGHKAVSVRKRHGETIVSVPDIPPWRTAVIVGWQQPRHHQEAYL